jgi:hypothetical protein
VKKVRSRVTIRNCTDYRGAVEWRMVHLAQSLYEDRPIRPHTCSTLWAGRGLTRGQIEVEPEHTCGSRFTTLSSVTLHAEYDRSRRRQLDFRNTSTTIVPTGSQASFLMTCTCTSASIQLPAMSPRSNRGEVAIAVSSAPRVKPGIARRLTIYGGSFPDQSPPHGPEHRAFRMNEANAHAGAVRTQ